MKLINPFFKKKKNVLISEVFKILGKKYNKKDYIIENIADLKTAKAKDITFFNSLKYLEFLKKTKSKNIITSKKYENITRKYSNPIIVENVLKSVAVITNLYYPNALDDAVDFSLNPPDKKKYPKVKFGKNVLLGKNVKIGSNSIIGHNSVIESNVIIGKNSVIGNNVIIKYSLIGKNVRILDASILGKKGFGFFPDKKNNFRYPHIGMVVIYDNVEIGCSNTIDRGSLSNTTIGQNTYIDNQVHIAHNVNIGKNCIITAQVGFAGSAKIGENVLIGGQAGISGHLRIGNNVQIGGGSGVVKNIPDNTKVMGYPAKDIKNFLKENK
mgnify:CR=1 FL=1